MLQSDFPPMTQLSGYWWSSEMHSMHGHVEQVPLIESTFKSLRVGAVFEFRSIFRSIFFHWIYASTPFNTIEKSFISLIRKNRVNYPILCSIQTLNCINMYYTSVEGTRYSHHQGFSQPSRRAERRSLSCLAKHWSGWRCNKIYLHEMQIKLHFSLKDILFASICGWNPVRLLKTSSSRRREACLTLRQTLKWALAMV